MVGQYLPYVQSDLYNASTPETVITARISAHIIVANQRKVKNTVPIPDSYSERFRWSWWGCYGWQFQAWSQWLFRCVTMNLLLYLPIECHYILLSSPKNHCHFLFKHTIFIKYHRINYQQQQFHSILSNFTYIFIFHHTNSVMFFYRQIQFLPCKWNHLTFCQFQYITGDFFFTIKMNHLAFNNTNSLKITKRLIYIQTSFPLWIYNL